MPHPPQDAEWANALADELARPTPLGPIAPEDRLYRLYPRHLHRLRQVPLSLPALLTSENNAAFLRHLYHHILLRAPDEAGYSAHLERLESGRISRTQLLLEFRLSLEGRQINRRIGRFWWDHAGMMLRLVMAKGLGRADKFIGKLVRER